MKQVQIIMGTPVIIEINDQEAREELFKEVFDYFKYVDQKFSTYKKDSEITAINDKKITKEEMSADMKLVFELSEETKKLTNGYFDIVTPNGSYDTSGLVKGWSIFNASKILKNRGVKNFSVEAGGDIQISGKNNKNEQWCVGIQNPFNKKREVVKKVYLDDNGIATSGNYVRGRHIYNPKDKNDYLEEIASLTVIGPNIFEADRFATAAFAMGKNGIYFIENLLGFEGYSIDKNGIATMTKGFDKYTKKHA
ncbi:MAG: FAD:protein FMN transferase [Candidatus Nomurabacteria bacterium]|nr:FAD:protein FMN transferase [Candidatus Nomurabacteria bacterium]